MTSCATDLVAEIARRGWRQADCARVLGWPSQTLSAVVNGDRALTPQMALDVEKLTGKPALTLLVQQVMEDLAEAELDPEAAAHRESISRRAALEDVVPLRDLIRLGHIDGSSDLVEQERQVCHLLGVKTIADRPEFTAKVATKRSHADAELTRLQVTWVALARRLAEGIDVGSFDVSNFAGFAAALPRRVHDPSGMVGMPQAFATVGVRLVYVPGLAGGQIDGVSLDYDGAPLIAISGRGARLDKVMFTLLHECAHVALGHWQKGVLVLHENGHFGDATQEAAANRLAQNWTLPCGIGTESTYSKATINRIARLNNVAEAMVIGQLQHLGKIPWATVLARGLPSAKEALDAW